MRIKQGVVITEISNKSPLKGLLNVGDIIIEAKRKRVTNSSDLKNIIESLKKADKNLLLSVIDNNNRRRYLGVKIN